MTALEELVCAWLAWDDRPADRARVVRLQAAVAAVTGDALGLRRRVEVLRRAGVPVREAIEQAVEQENR